MFFKRRLQNLVQFNSVEPAAETFLRLCKLTYSHLPMVAGCT